MTTSAGETSSTTSSSTWSQGHSASPKDEATCAAMPWGDASYQSANLIQHMMMRHQFDYDSTADFGESEDDVLRRVLEASRTDC